MKHTPEPWEVSQDDIIKRLSNGMGAHICTFQYSVYREEQAGNMALVANAPAMKTKIERLEKINAEFRAVCEWALAAEKALPENIQHKELQLALEQLIAKAKRE